MSRRDRIQRVARRAKGKPITPETRAELEAALAEVQEIMLDWPDDDPDGLQAFVEEVAASIEAATT